MDFEELLTEEQKQKLREHARKIANKQLVSRTYHELANDSWRRRWYDIEYGFRHYVLGWDDEGIKGYLRSMEQFMIKSGKEPLPDVINYYSERHHERNSLRVKP